MRLLAGAGLLLTLATAGAAEELKVAIGIDNEPHGIMAVALADRETAAGSGTGPLKEELAREICQRLHVRCQVEAEHIGHILPAIAERRFDLGFGMFLRTPERAGHFQFSEPVWQASSRLLATQDGNAAWESRLGEPVTLASLRDARLVAVAGSAQYAALNALARTQNLRVEGSETLADVIAAIAAGDADFALVPVFSAYTLLRSMDGPPLVFAGAPLTADNLGGSARIALPRDAEPLRRKVNSALAAMRKDGTWQRIMRRHLPIGLY
ncbi:MAG: transporter substrate-binding domain-containing protein [Betaproteobacteria bacterium]|nr:transporter substrate-binding domain-containing protein [Betaproteobacteria bacterium]